VPGLVRLTVTVSQRELTVTCGGADHDHGQPGNRMSRRRQYARLTGYTFERAAGELWRCRFDIERNIIVVNSGHRDFVLPP